MELLEVIKLFMDVERCVFALAFDYEVVVMPILFHCYRQSDKVLFNNAAD